MQVHHTSGDAVFSTAILSYRIAGNFRLEKIFAFFTQVCHGRKFFRRIILPSENFIVLKFLYVAGKQY